MTSWLFDPVLAWIYCGYLFFTKLLSPNGKLVSIMARTGKDGVKTYGGGAKQAQRLPEPYPFRLAGLRYDEEETHDLTAIRKPDTLMAIRFMGMGEDQGAELGQLCVKLIGKTLDNADGVPAQWEAVALPKPRNAGPKWEPKFRGPDGNLHPMEQRAKFEDFAKGSSRRRWEALLADNEFTVEVEVLAEIVEDLVGLTTGTPTDG